VWGWFLADQVVNSFLYTDYEKVIYASIAPDVPCGEACVCGGGCGAMRSLCGMFLCWFVCAH